MKAICYVRVSTDEQAENGTSLETQELTCLRRAASMGAAVVGTCRDEGVSGGFYLARPGIQEALTALESGRAELLIVANLSRFSRDAEHQQQIKKRIERAGGRLVLCDMDLASTPEGDLQFGIMGQFAQYERQVIRERTMTGRKRRAEQGLQPCRAQSPMGYHVVTHAEALSGIYGDAPAGSYLLLEEEAQIMRELYRRADAGESLRALAKWLIAAGVPTRRGGTTWYAATVRAVLCNPVYKGEPTFGRTDRHTDEERLKAGYSPHYRRPAPVESWVTLTCEPIVDAATWERVQERLEENKALQGGPRMTRYLLSGLMRCTKCDRRMSGRWIHRKDQGPHYYCCVRAWKSMDIAGRQCTPGLHRGDTLEPATLRTLLYASRHPHLFMTALRAFYQMRAGNRHDGGADLQRLQAQLRELAQRETLTAKAQVQALMEGRSAEVYERLLVEIHNERQTLEARIASQQPAAFSDPLPDFDTDIERVAEVLRRLEVVLSAPDVPTSEKRAILVTIVKAIRPLGTPAEGRYAMELRGASSSVYSIEIEYTVRDEPPVVHVVERCQGERAA